MPPCHAPCCKSCTAAEPTVLVFATTLHPAGWWEVEEDVLQRDCKWILYCRGDSGDLPVTRCSPASKLASSNDSEDPAREDNVRTLEAKHGELHVDLVERCASNRDVGGAVDEASSSPEPRSGATHVQRSGGIDAKIERHAQE